MPDTKQQRNRLNAALSDAVFEKIKSLAESEHRSMSQMVRILIEEALAGRSVSLSNRREP